MDWKNILWLTLGLVVLTIGAELLVRGASRLAAAARISPLVIGLTVVAFGTSAPEMAVSVNSAWNGEADIALGNVVGSNIFNVLFILGACAVITPLAVAAQLIRIDTPLMLLVSIALWAMGMDGRISVVDGWILVAGLIGYTVMAVRMGRRAAQAVQDEFAHEQPKAAMGGAAMAVSALLVLAGLAALVLGAEWFVESAKVMARAFGVSELVIGLTIVAAGTSMPEVATSIMASIKGERDIAVGNVVGSNIFNILGVLGFSAGISGSGVAVAPAALSFDIPVMVAVAFACLPIFFTGHSIARWEGVVFFGYYAAYTAYLVLAQSKHDALEPFSRTMLYAVLPLTVLTLAVTTTRAIRARRLID